MPLQQFDRWGHLVVMDIFRPSIRKPALSGGTYDTGELGPPVLELACECGHEFRVPLAQFPGKRKLRSCLQANCEYANPPKPAPKRMGRPPSADPGSMISVYLPDSMLARIKVIGEELGLNRSRVIAGLIQQAIADNNELK